jgi:hypothetical protein
MGVPKGRKLEGAGKSNSEIFAKVKIVKNLTSESKYGKRFNNVLISGILVSRKSKPTYFSIII